MFEPLPVVSLLMAACFVAVFANGFVCYLIVSVPRLKNVTNYVFVFSLCLCDIMFAGVLIPTHCFFQTAQQGLFYKFLTIITVLIYIANLACTTYERLISITQPMRYLTKSKAIRYVIFCWTLPVVYCCLPLLWKVHTQLLMHKVFLVFTLVAFLVLPFVFIAYVYVRICMEIKRINSKDPHRRSTSGLSTGSIDLKRNRKQSSSGLTMSCFLKKEQEDVKDMSTIQVGGGEDVQSNSSLRSTSTIGATDAERLSIISDKNINQSIKKRKRVAKKRKRKEIRASLPFALTTLMYMSTWLPVIYLTLLDTIDRLDLAPEVVFKFSIFAIVLNTVTVPLIYGLLLPDFRFTLKRIFAKQRLRYFR